MTDLLRILTTGASSLAAQTAAAATASHNLENANTPGYARQRVNIEAMLPADQVGNAYLGNGARATTVTQARDRFFESQLPALFGQASSSSAASTTLSSVHALDPELSGGLGDALSGFYTAFRQLSQNPSDAGLRQSAVNAARSLALSFNQTRASLEDARSGVDQKLAADVSEANTLAQGVASLNGQIRAARASGAEPNDLLDARQKSVDRLAELTGASPVTTVEGDTSLFMAGGAPLVVSLQASTLSTQGDPLDAGHLSLRLNSGLVQSAVAPGGELGGLVAARDGALKDGVSAIDTLALDLSGAVNTAHQAGVDLATGASGEPLFTGTSARDLAVNANIVADPRLLATRRATGGVGDASNLTAADGILATESLTLSTGLSADGALSSATAAFGAATRTFSAQSDADTALRDHLTTVRESVSGVSVDDELVDLQKAQRAYQAISKVIQTSSDMFDTLLALK